MRKSILVIGATGKQGYAVVRQLLDEGWHVRAFTRNRDNEKLRMIQDAHLEIFEGDLSYITDLTKAMENQYGLYIVQPIIHGDAEETERRGRRMIQVAETQKIQHVVHSTAGGVNRDRTGEHFEALARIENILKASTLSYTIIKPTFFMDNFLRIATVGENHIEIPEFITPDIPFAMIPSEDIAKIAATIFGNPKAYEKQEIEIASDELSLNQVVETFEAVTGKKTEIKGVFSSQTAERTWLEEKGYIVDFETIARLNPGRLKLKDWIYKYFN